MSEQSKALMRRGIEEVWTRGNFTVAGELLASDFVVHASQQIGELHGPEGVTRYFAALREAFPDLHFTIEDQVAEGDRAVTRWTARGTHRGAFRGIPPSGKQVSLAGINIIRVAGGKAVEGWMSLDELGLLRQLGALPAPGQGRAA
jgi:steroid delta-isomerase-like uncharacterized protein